MRSRPGGKYPSTIDVDPGPTAWKVTSSMSFPPTRPPDARDRRYVVETYRATVAAGQLVTRHV